MLVLGAASWGLPNTPGVTEQKFASGGLERSFRLTLPRQYDQRRYLPLVMLIHGWTSDALSFESYSQFRELAQKEGFILVTPQGLGQPTGWNCGFINLGKAGVDDLGFLDNLLKDVTSQLMVDKRRIYLVGHSNGAMMAGALAARCGDRLAGIAAVSGLIGVGMPGREKMIPTPDAVPSILHIHGDADAVVGYDRSAKAVLKGLPETDAVRWWASQAGMPLNPLKNENAVFSEITYQKGPKVVKLITLKGQGHDWATSSRGGFDTAGTIWNFFKRAIKL